MTYLCVLAMMVKLCMRKREMVHEEENNMEDTGLL